MTYFLLQGTLQFKTCILKLIVPFRKVPHWKSSTSLVTLSISWKRLTLGQEYPICALVPPLMAG